MRNTICFLVEKPAQFDVPFFRFVAQQTGSNWQLVVVYIQNPLQQLTDIELRTPSNWGIDLVGGYNWQWIGTKPAKEEIRTLFEAIKPALMITNGYKLDYKLFLQVARSMKIPLALRIDSVLFGHGKAGLLLRKLVMWYRYRYFKGFMTTGKIGYDYLDYIGIPPEKQFWFPYCTDNSLFASGEISPNDQAARQKVLLGICKFNERENPEAILQAFCSINDASLQLILIGDGPLMNALKTYPALFPQLNICLPGYVRYLDLPGWYRKAGLFIHTAINEPWGVSVQEALAAGCRVVASSHVGSAPDLIQAGENGFIFPSGDKERLQHALLLALQIPLLQAQLANKNLLDTKWNYASVWTGMQAAAERMVISES